MFKLPTPLHATRGLLPSPYFSMKYDRGVNGGKCTREVLGREAKIKTFYFVRRR